MIVSYYYGYSCAIGIKHPFIVATQHNYYYNYCLCMWHYNGIQISPAHQLMQIDRNLFELQYTIILNDFEQATISCNYY